MLGSAFETETHVTLIFSKVCHDRL